MATTGGTRYKVLYDYDASIPEELTIRVGQTVFVTEELEKGWVRGYIGDKVGMFPAAYVEPDTSSSGAPSMGLPAAPSAAKLHSAIEGGPAVAETAQVIEEFPSKDASQLPLVKDQLVVIFRKFPTGWASGESQGKTGMFPLKNVRILDVNEAAALVAQSASPTIISNSIAKKVANKEKRMSRVRSSTIASTTRVRNCSCTPSRALLPPFCSLSFSNPLLPPFPFHINQLAFLLRHSIHSTDLWKADTRGDGSPRSFQRYFWHWCAFDRCISVENTCLLRYPRSFAGLVQCGVHLVSRERERERAYHGAPHFCVFRSGWPLRPPLLCPSCSSCLLLSLLSPVFT